MHLCSNKIVLILFSNFLLKIEKIPHIFGHFWTKGYVEISNTILRIYSCV